VWRGRLWQWPAAFAEDSNRAALNGSGVLLSARPEALSQRKMGYLRGRPSGGVDNRLSGRGVPFSPSIDEMANLLRSLHHTFPFLVGVALSTCICRTLPCSACLVAGKCALHAGVECWKGSNQASSDASALTNQFEARAVKPPPWLPGGGTVCAKTRTETPGPTNGLDGSSKRSGDDIVGSHIFLLLIGNGAEFLRRICILSPPGRAFQPFSVASNLVLLPFYSGFPFA